MTDILDPVAPGEAGDSSAAVIRDMATELRDMRRADGVYDGIKLQPAKDNAVETGVLPDPQKLQSIPVRVEGVAGSANTDSLAQKYIEKSQEPSVNAEAARKLTDAGVDDGRLEHAAEFSEGVAAQFEGARTLGELKAQADIYLTRGIVEKDDWYQAMPGNSRGQIIMERLETARQKLEHRGAVEAASARVSKAFDGIKERVSQGLEVHSERKEQKATEKEYDAFDEEMDALRSNIKAERELSEDSIREEAYAELAAFDARKAQETRDKALIGPSSFEDYVKDKVDKAVEPYRKSIEELRVRKNKTLAISNKMPVVKRKDLEARFAHEEAKLRKDLDDVRDKATKEADESQARLVDGLYEQSGKIHEFEINPEATSHVYKPDANLDAELAALVAHANGQLVGRQDTPFSIDEYDIPHHKKAPTRMQRLVYKTDKDDVLIVEDWDKTSGKLMRQSIVRGEKLLVPDYENDGLGRVRSRFRKNSGKSEEVLSNDVYKSLGVLGSTDVVASADTSASGGYEGYVRNLTRSGGVGLDVAKNLAKPELKPKANKGFIAMLQEEWAKSKAAKKK